MDSFDQRRLNVLIAATTMASALLLGSGLPGVVTAVLVGHAPRSSWAELLFVIGLLGVSAVEVVLAPWAEARALGVRGEGLVVEALLPRGLVAAGSMGLAGALVHVFRAAPTPESLGLAQGAVIAWIGSGLGAVGLEARALRARLRAACGELAPWSATIGLVVEHAGALLAATWAGLALARLATAAPAINPLGTAETLRVQLESQGVSWALGFAVAAAVHEALRRRRVRWCVSVAAVR